ncbi:ABC transporter ATP-binding protein [Candidatus Solirubrobacter pratensis]|uniref:ABC transporter ATP-binding protein n=1 Tax=Candidatus Solirubrobacter pratensis TaxID=1298857 RepID=UPI000416F1B1|nr:ABC transporter ATP-binding protein [Candidatus Solirubrobacter pratensis]
MTAFADEPLLEVERLRVTYGGSVLALDGVDFSVPDGGAVALVGANGAGKTTALRAVTGLLRFHGGQVTTGTIRFAGRSIERADAASLVAAGIGQVLEGRRVFADLSVAENLRIGAFQNRTGRPERQIRDELGELFPMLAERADQPAGQLSGGQQQIVAIARALMAQPRLLLLDEPSLGLAPRVVAQIGEALRTVNERGCALLLVEQSTALALRVTEHAYLLETGRVRAHAPTAELLADERVRASYLGTSAVPVA